MKKIYRHPLSALGTFTYHDWEGDGTIQHIGDIEPNRYYFVDEGMPLPTSEVASFELVNLTDDLAAQLRSVAMPDVVVPIKSQNEEKRAKLQVLNDQRDAALDSGAKFGGNTFHSNAGFLTELLGLVLGYQAGVMTGKANIRTMGRSSPSWPRQLVTTAKVSTPSPGPTRTQSSREPRNDQGPHQE
jgi:hypothetical protein